MNNKNEKEQKNVEKEQKKMYSYGKLWEEQKDEQFLIYANKKYDKIYKIKEIKLWAQ